MPRYYRSHLRVQHGSEIPGRAGLEAMCHEAGDRIGVLLALDSRHARRGKASVAAVPDLPVDDAYLVESMGLAERLQERADDMEVNTEKDKALARKLRQLRPSVYDAVNASCFGTRPMPCSTTATVPPGTGKSGM